MQSQGLKYGIGVDENTALIVTGGSHVEVLGDRGAVVMDLSQASVDQNIKQFNLKNCRLSYLDSGDEFDLTTLAVTPAPREAKRRQDRSQRGRLQA